MTMFLASVTSIAEARIALEADADIIDLKNPAQGALGALPLSVIEQVLRFVDGRKPVSATVGDLPMQPNILLAAVEATSAAGADIVKVGLFGRHGHAECIEALAPAARRGIKIVAVMLADQQPNFSLLPTLAAAGFYGVMLDTADKTSGGLRNWLSEADLRDFIHMARMHGLLAGLAGALRAFDIRPLGELMPDYLGFRGALCDDDLRESALDAARVNAIRDAVAQMRQHGYARGSSGCKGNRHCV